MNYNNESVCSCCSTQYRDPNFWKSKIWRLFLFAFLTPPPPEYQWSTPPTHPLKHNLIQSLIGLGHYMKSYMGYGTITISVYDCNGEIIFVTDEIHAKMPQKPNFDWKKIRILGENGIIPNQSTENLITRFYPGDLLTRTGRDCCRIRESWHVW